MATLTVQQIDLDGLTPAFVAADGAGDQFANKGKTYLHVVNGGAGAVAVTVDSIQNCNQGFDHNGGGSVAAGAEGLFGPFSANRFNDPNNSNRVVVTYDVVTSVTVGAFSL